MAKDATAVTAVGVRLGHAWRSRIMGEMAVVDRNLAVLDISAAAVPGQTIGDGHTGYCRTVATVEIESASLFIAVDDGRRHNVGVVWVCTANRQSLPLEVDVIVARTEVCTGSQHYGVAGPRYIHGALNGGDMQRYLERAVLFGGNNESDGERVRRILSVVAGEFQKAFICSDIQARGIEGQIDIICLLRRDAS